WRNCRIRYLYQMNFKNIHTSSLILCFLLLATLPVRAQYAVYMDFDTHEMLLIDAKSDKIYYSSDKTQGIALTIVKKESSKGISEYRFQYFVRFPGDSKNYTLTMYSPGCGSDYINCKNPDGSTQEFVFISSSVSLNTVPKRLILKL